jgi:hypothetical protein
MDKQKSGRLSSREKLLALRAVSPGTCLIAVGDGWQLIFGPRTKFSTNLDVSKFRGLDPETAINEAWFWITQEDYTDNPQDNRDRRIVSPAEQASVIEKRKVTFHDDLSQQDGLDREIEIWWKWSSWGWEPYVIQES